MTWRIHTGDALDVLRGMDAESFHCCATSPPYWGLRDYGTAEWKDGDTDCDHRKPDRQGKTGQRATRTTGHDDIFPNICGKCGAHRTDRQLGLERTPEEYVEKLVAVFREVRRVLRSDGTLWLVLGDGYTSGGRNEWRSGASDNKGQQVLDNAKHRPDTPPGLKPKDLIGIPWRVAFALQADGWWLRSDIIWSKPNPLPESVTDRPTKAHEYVFLMAKAERYWYDADAIKEPVTGNAHSRGNGVNPKCAEPGSGIKMNTSFSAAVNELVSERNKRSVWTVPTYPYPEAHFATYPPDLIEPCILAGCPVGGIVLDPFAGTGTTALVALRRGRNFIGIELNPETVKLANKRIETPLFNRIPVEVCP